MRRALTVLAGAVLALLPLGVAQAQTPLPTAIEVVNECGLVTLTFTGPKDGTSGTHGFRWNAVNGSVATDEGARTGTVVVGDADVKTVDIVFPEDEFGGTAAVTVAVFFGPNSHLQKPLDIYPVDTDCADPVTETPTPTTTPAATTTPTTSAAATTTPEAPVAELDCGDFPLPDGRTAQDVLDADTTDPHILDGDGDGIACDADDEDGAFTQTGVVPSGSVATGG